MKICIVSDSHDRTEPLAAAIAKAQAAGAQAIIHCGDLIDANTLRASIKPGVPLHVVHGNNLGHVMAMHKMMAKSGGLFTYHGQGAELDLGGRRIFATHYPHYGRGMACTGDYDLVCCGHSHVAESSGNPTSRADRLGWSTPVRFPASMQPMSMRHLPGYWAT